VDYFGNLTKEIQNMSFDSIGHAAKFFRRIAKVVEIMLRRFDMGISSVASLEIK
jgi:hypothetical protein